MAGFGRKRQVGPETLVLRADARYPQVSPGIRTLHCFSSGAHYDEHNVSFAALVGVDEHVVDPGGGFDRHAHRGVAIVTWVLAGALRHEDSTGASHVVHPGTVAVQIAGRGIEHTETNASSSEPVRFVQTTLLCDDDEPSYRLAAPPVLAGPALFDVHRQGPLLLESAKAHLFAAEGSFGFGRDGLAAGDSLRIEAAAQVPLDTPLVEGNGQLLVTLLR